MVTEGIARVGDGELYYQLDGSGPDVALLHGGMLTHAMWDGEFKHLVRAGYRVLRFDFRSCGRSSTATSSYSNHEDVRAVLSTLGIERAALVGLSLGARVAVDFALAHAESVTALVLLAPGISGMEFVDPFIVEMMRKQDLAAAERDADAVIENFLRMWVDGPRRVPDAVDASLRSRCREMATETLFNIAQATVAASELGAISRLHEIRVPTLAMAGQQDSSDIQKVVDLIGANVPGAETLSVPAAGHMLNMEAPEIVLAAILERLAALGPPV